MRELSWNLQADSPKKNKDAIKEPLHCSGLLQESSVQLIKSVQEKIFSAEHKVSMSRDKDMTIPRGSKIKQLDPFLNGNGIMCWRSTEKIIFE